MVRTKIISIVYHLLPIWIKNKVINESYQNSQNVNKYSTQSYAQEGEDMVLSRFLETKNNGFYVDIGAHHPQRFSNTFIFYNKGWNGINVDPMPGSMKAFKNLRPRDINLEIGISREEQQLPYYIFNEPALNTFSKEEAAKKDGLRSFKIIEQKTIHTFPLQEVLQNYLPKNQKIDFMTIDVEGLDLEVLESNDWEKYRPNMLLVEDLKRHTIAELPVRSATYSFLVANEYALVAKTFNTLFFKDLRN